MTEQWNHIYTRGDEKWVSRSEAKRRFKLTDVQLSLAMNRGLVRSQQKLNLYNNKPFDLLNLGDLETNLEKIRLLQREGGFVRT